MTLSVSLLMSTAAVCAAASFLAACTSLSVPEDAFFWPETRVLQENLTLLADPPPAGAEDFTVAYSEGAVAATYLRSEAPGTLILYCGGNTFRRRSGGGSAAVKLNPFGDAILFDYPGYGETDGQATIANFQAVTGAMATAARRRGDADGLSLIAWGHSLGGAVCSEAARAADADLLILETTPPGAQSLIDSRLGLLRPFVRVDIDPAFAAFDVPRSLSGYDGRVVILEAGRDETLPPVLNRRLAATLRAQGQRVELLSFPNADHHGIGSQSDFRARLDEIVKDRRGFDDFHE